MKVEIIFPGTTKRSAYVSGNWCRLMFLLCLLLFVVTPSIQAQQRFLVSLKKMYRSEINTTEKLYKKLTKSVGRKVTENLSIKRLAEDTDTPSARDLFVIQAGTVAHEVMEAYEAAGIFEYIEPDHLGYAAAVQPADPGFGKQWYLYNDGSFELAKAGADISLLDAWAITRGDSAIVVAILDSGILPDHLEFAGRLWKNPHPVKNDKIGWDFIHNDNDPYDDNGHGTAVAGVLAANANNEVGIAGIDQYCKLMICKVLDHNLTGYYSQWIAGLYYAVDHGARIINFSLAGEEPSRALKEAIEYAESKGVLVVAAMQNFNTAKPYYPAAYTHAVAVGATDPDDSRSVAFQGDSRHGSNYGDHIDVVAPGNYIFGLDASQDHHGAMWAGTSLATPVVSGVASLLLAQDPSRTARDLKAILYASGEDEVGDPHEDTPGWDTFYGYGRVDAFAALQAHHAPLPEENRLYLYPNPACSEVNISLVQDLPSSLQISLWDSRGNLVKGWSEKDHTRLIQRTLELDGLSPGIYLVKVNAFSRTYVQRLVIIK